MHKNVISKETTHSRALRKGTKKRFEELQFTDDFLFGRIMQNRELCKEVLECLLQHPVGILRDPLGQKELKFLSDGKPIRLDIYTSDEYSLYDAEMQNQNNRSIEELALPRRARFYQANMDVNYLMEGVSYRELPDSQILFICTFDPFEQGKAVYTFTSKCTEQSGLEMKDGITKYFFNCTYVGTDLPDDLRDLYEYIRTGRKGEAKVVEHLDVAIRDALRNEEWRDLYMKELLHDDDMRAEGRAEGRAEERLNTERERKRADELLNQNKALMEELALLRQKITPHSLH